jgi:hypothetical protein
LGTEQLAADARRTKVAWSTARWAVFVFIALASSLLSAAIVIEMLTCNSAKVQRCSALPGWLYPSSLGVYFLFQFCALGVALPLRRFLARHSACPSR